MEQGRTGYRVLAERVGPIKWHYTTAPSIKQYRAPIKSINSVQNLFIVLTHKIWSLDDFFQGLSLFSSPGLLWAGGGGSLSVVCPIVPGSRVIITLRDLHDQWLTYLFINPSIISNMLEGGEGRGQQNIVTSVSCLLQHNGTCLQGQSFFLFLSYLNTSPNKISFCNVLSFWLLIFLVQKL